MEDFRIDGSALSGRIPDFIGNWTRLDRLDWQGTGMEGPIPSTISLLRNLTELRITDLAGSLSMSFPNLRDMTGLERLTLRNCMLTGPIPDYIGQMSDMKNLDLSFNRLNGPIPNTIQRLNFDTMFLNNNSLSGEIPQWIFDSREKIDLSYNNFTRMSSLQSCQSSNLFTVHATLHREIADGQMEGHLCLSHEGQKLESNKMSSGEIVEKEINKQGIKGFMTFEALKHKKLFLLDYHDLLLPYVNEVRELEGTTLYGSRTLMFLTVTDTLKPVAIELTRPPTNGKPQWNQVYITNSDDTNIQAWLWKLAKAHVLAHLLKKKDEDCIQSLSA